MAEFPFEEEDRGEPTKPILPKNYKTTTPQQRTDWNSFLDYAGKQNLDFDKDPKLGASLMAQYKKTNPNFSLTPDDLQRIQYEHYQIRKGDNFSTLKPEQLKYLRQGLPEAYLNRPVDTTGAFTGNTSKLYYPQKTQGDKAYGTDIEGYVNGIGGVTTPATQIESSNAQPTNAIPLPNYDDPKSRLDYIKQVAKKYGDFVHGRGDYLVRLNEVPKYGNISAKEASLQEAKKHNLDPSLLYASTMEEGASGLYPDAKGETSEGEGTSEKYPVSGYGNYGLDNFHDDYKEMVKKGYLPNDFEYEKHGTKNENGTPVNSANFRNTEDAMKAKAAYIHLYQDRIDDYLKKTGTEMSPKAKQFFTLIGFNGGEGTARKLIKYYKEKGLLKGDKFLATPPDKSVDPGGAFGHVLPRLQVADMLKKEGLFQ